MTAFPAALGLDRERIEQVIRLAGTAPSLHNVQPWRFRVLPEVIEVHADADRRLPATDPGDSELRLGCGAALFNLRLALEHYGVRPWVSLTPYSEDPTILAAVRHAGSVRPQTEQTELYRAITDRRTNRRPFLPAPVPATRRHALVGAVETEHSWLYVVKRTQRSRLIGLVRRAHDVQLADAAFRAEIAHWTGKRPGVRAGVPAQSAGPRPESQDEWVLRDFSGGQARARVPGKDFEDDPLMLVLYSYSSGRAVDVRAGQALQRLLLTATSLGLAVSFLSPVVEVRETSEELRSLLGATVRPHAVLRVGYGSPVPATPRRAPEELLVDDEWTALELGPQRARPAR